MATVIAVSATRLKGVPGVCEFWEAGKGALEANLMSLRALLKGSRNNPQKDQQNNPQNAPIFYVWIFLKLLISY